MQDWMIYVLIGIGAYLLGSVSPAIIISDQVAKKDVRKYGSGNAGTTNMVRTFGWKFGLLTFLSDILKGALAAYLGGLFGGEIGACVAGVLVVVGHNWPIYYRFHGGKGIAATAGVLLVLMPLYTAIALAAVLIFIAIVRIVSIGSLVGVLVEVAISFIFYPGKTWLHIAVCLLAVLAIFGHRCNIDRLIHGKENVLDLSKEPTVPVEEPHKEGHGSDKQE